MHELTKLTEAWVIRHGNLIVHTEGYSNIGQWESEVLLPYMREHDNKKLFEHADRLLRESFWGIEKRKEQALWLKGKKFGRVAGYIKDEEIDQAFGIEKKSLEENIQQKVCEKIGEPIELDTVKEIIQTIKSHYGIEDK